MNIEKLKKSVSVVALLAVGLIAMDAEAKDITQKRDVATFTGIVVEGAMNLEVKVGGKQSVSITTDDNYMDRVETRIEGGQLVIGQKGRHWNNIELTVKISVAELNDFTVEGAADAEIYGIKSDNFNVDIGGAVDLTLEGTCKKARYEINGAGDINARDFKCQDVEVTINGAGDADVYASEKIKATLNGIGNVSVYGNPSVIRPRINGLGGFEIK